MGSRGTDQNPTNRFENVDRVMVEEGDDTAIPSPRTQLIPDRTRTILSQNNSPDVGFEVSLNPYRGCEHGCIYCYARPTHEYLGYSAGLDFETKILVKERAPELLRQTLAAPGWTPKVVSISGVTDPYQPVERKLGLTRRCLEVFAEFRNPLFIVTKNALVTRDLDYLTVLAEHDAAAVFVSVTTLDYDLAGVMEPRTSRPGRRLEAIKTLAQCGIPVGVFMAPVIPGLTDHEIPAVLEKAREAGARFAGYVPIRLPYGLKELFENWLETHFPARKEKVLSRIREVRGGRLNDSSFSTRMRGEGVMADSLRALFQVTKKRLGFEKLPELSCSAFQRLPQPGEQLPLL